MKRTALAALATAALALGTVYAVNQPSDTAAPTAGIELPQAPPPSPASETVVVTRAVDGDTAVLQDGRRVRVLVMDACERATPGGKRATRDAKRLLEGRSVVLERGRVDVDHFRRLLRYVALPDGRDFAETMLRESHTHVYTGRSDASPQRLAAGRRADTDGRDCSR